MRGTMEYFPTPKNLDDTLEGFCKFLHKKGIKNFLDYIQLAFPKYAEIEEKIESAIDEKLAAPNSTTENYSATQLTLLNKLKIYSHSIIEIDELINNIESVIETIHARTVVFHNNHALNGIFIATTENEESAFFDLQEIKEWLESAAKDCHNLDLQNCTGMINEELIRYFYLTNENEEFATAMHAKLEQFPELKNWINNHPIMLEKKLAQREWFKKLLTSGLENIKTQKIAIEQIKLQLNATSSLEQPNIEIYIKFLSTIQNWTQAIESFSLNLDKLPYKLKTQYSSLINKSEQLALEKKSELTSLQQSLENMQLKDAVLNALPENSAVWEWLFKEILNLETDRPSFSLTMR